jgi:hypothetical protein
VRRTWLSGTALLVTFALGLTGCGASSPRSEPAPGRGTTFTLSGGVRGTGHGGMTASTMSGMSMSGSPSVTDDGAYLDETPHGRASLLQAGDRLSGWVSVSGLPPGSHHAETLDGPAGSCTAATDHRAPVSVDLPDLVADAHGVARAEIAVSVRRDVMSSGFTLDVHRDPTLAEVDDIGSASAAPSVSASPNTDPTILCGSVAAKTR